MDWKKPNKNIFWVPVPYTGQNLYDLTEWKRTPEATRQTIQLTEPKTDKTELFEIIDYLGIYTMDKIPDFLAFDCTDSTKITGRILAATLVMKKPEFRGIEKVVFYQLTKIL